MIEDNKLSYELEAKLDGQPLTIENIDRMWSDMEAGLISSDYLPDHLRLARMRAERLLAENTENPKISAYATAKLKELHLAIAKTENVAGEFKGIHYDKAANDDDYPQLTDDAPSPSETLRQMNEKTQKTV